MIQQNDSVIVSPHGPRCDHEQPLRLLFLIDQLMRGGTEGQVSKIADALPRDRFEPTIGVLREHAQQSSMHIATRVVDFKVVGAPLLKSLRFVWRLKRFIETERVDLLQTHFVEAEMHGVLTARICRRRPVVVVTRRNLYHWVPEDRLRFVIVRWLVRWADHVLCNSHVARDVCMRRESVSPAKISVVQNAVDIEKFVHTDSRNARRSLGLPEAGPVVGVVSNWRPVKGLVSFLKAAALVARVVPSTRFVIVGSGPQEQELHGVAYALGVRENVLFVGMQCDVAGILPAFDVAVQPSLSESFSNVLVEYMAAARPIVATRVGDAERVIHDGVTGLLVQSDAPEEMARAILRLCQEPEVAASIASRAYKVVRENWSLDKIMKQYHDLYCTLLAARRGTR